MRATREAAFRTEASMSIKVHQRIEVKANWLRKRSKKGKRKEELMQKVSN